MKKITLPVASRLTSPNPLTLVCTTKPDGTANLASVSWWTYLSFNPDMIAFAMAKTSYTGERVRETRKAVLAMPAEGLEEAVAGCGSTTGRDTDKAGKFGVELASVDGTDIKIPALTRVAIVCTLKEYVETGDHYLYICTVDEALGDPTREALFAWNGYSQIRTAK
ncbi:flavin reductase family protein [Cloacibacillus sp. An23]|uniref:flavin reductase family protein n=1 Tax=Cloacibacillus sp. An23 TaxID=1965591 RepID=UPI000B37E0B6|nr:flavin reductase family protein [Cloacibacillus sp. An23]OUO93739.1 flavin reductase [Cloacibacillus sp. An23]